MYTPDSTSRERGYGTALMNYRALYRITREAQGVQDTYQW